jgi:hypothetical protein
VLAGYGSDDEYVGRLARVPFYDQRWSATGPLIERYGIALVRCANNDWLALASLSYAYDHPNVDGELLYCIDVYGVQGERAPTPLVAACRLILVLAKAGKLPTPPVGASDAPRKGKSPAKR